MSKFSYSDLCNALGPIGGGMARDPYVKIFITKILAFHAESGLKNVLHVNVKNGNIEFTCDQKTFALIAMMVSKWLGENWVPAEDVYYEVLEYTNFSRSVTRQDFIDKLKKIDLGVIRCVEENSSSQDEHYFIERKSVKRFIAMEYGAEYARAKSGSYSNYRSSNLGDKVPGSEVAFYAQNQESVAKQYAVSQPLTFQNFMEPKLPYIRDMDKKDTLDGLIKTFVKRHQDLEKQQTVLEPNEKREAKIKAIIMDLVFLLKTQSEYIKKYFNLDINDLVQKYDSGNWMSASEVMLFFYSKTLPQQIIVSSFDHTM